ncbi:DUF2798 domain-containing protein [Litoreibacter janthinus]|uniref:DUF2798 domain-containing protein n=1 Tax=Litoreibacter janthinus TaxID=670154 RepID=A0A1I6G8G0_9RHOB|nr:DUF2798 domain-containing protein [Litoreibacter janthinus]SFR38479.1 Protein of unknown function [Litoreibacter janthinus]
MTRLLLAHVLFSAVTSALMSALVCGVATFRMVGASGAFMHVWSGSWIFAWPAAFIVLASIGPLVRKTVYRGCKCPVAVPVAAQRSTPSQAQN